MAGRTKLVTGASGFLGSHVTRQLVKRGDDVRVFIRKTSPTKALDGDAVARVRGKDSRLSKTSVRLMHVWPPLEHGKAERELGWRPEPIDDSIRSAAHWLREQRRHSRINGSDGQA